MLKLNCGIRKNILFLLAFVFMARLSFSQKVVQPITGTFVTLQFQDLRNKYMNPPDVDQTTEFWDTKLKEYANTGLQFIIIQFVANRGKAFYPSKIMPHAYPEGTISPVDAIMTASNKYGFNVILGAGWAYDQYDNPAKQLTLDRIKQIMEELNELYHHDPSFYGWYIPAEADLSQIITSKTMVKDINSLTVAAKKIAPNKKVMISPYGIWNADIYDRRFAQQIKKLKVDIIAYQDEVGCVREPFPIPKMKKNFKRIGEITRSAGIAFWSNIESFTWTDKPNSHLSALIPAPFARTLSQMVGASEASADRLISFSIFGVMDKPKSKFPIGQPFYANRYYKAYMNWKNGIGRWGLLEKTFFGSVPNLATGCEIKFTTNPAEKYKKGNLTNDVFGVEDFHDKEWLGFDNGKMQFVLDLGKIKKFDTIALRFLQYSPSAILFPRKLKVLLSKDGQSYQKMGVITRKDFAQDHLDCWVDIGMLSQLNAEARYIKVIANNEAESWIFCDEVIVK